MGIVALDRITSIAELGRNPMGIVALDRILLDLI